MSSKYLFNLPALISGHNYYQNIYHQYSDFQFSTRFFTEIQMLKLFGSKFLNFPLNQAYKIHSNQAYKIHY